MPSTRILSLALAGSVALPLLALAQGQPATGQPPGVPLLAAPGLDDPSFGSAARSVPQLTLTPEMILELGRRFRENKGAQEEVMAPSMAMPVTRSVNASLGPGGATSIIQAVQGYPTAIAFVDSTGQPWPIAWEVNSDPASEGGGGASGGAPAVQAIGFDVKVPVKGSNVLHLAPRSSTPRGGLLVNLQGAPVPLTFMMMGGRDRYDARVDVRVAGRGPNARVQIITRPDTPETGASYLTAMLDGAPPAEAVPLSVSGVSPDDVRAWRLGGKVYLRTQYTVLSPEWTASEMGPNNMAIYAIPSTPVILLSANGRSVAARLTEQ
jgi:intracellular multiplication protein IcmK